MTPDERMKAIQALYELVPKLTGCKGLCNSACVRTVDMSTLERERIQHRHQIKLTPKPAHIAARSGHGKCRALKKNGQCGVYEDRPLICRAWGAIEPAPCPFGCKPDDGVYLTDAEYKALQFAVEELGGHPERTSDDRKRILAFMGTPQGQAMLKTQMDKAREETLRMREQVSHASAEGSNV